MTKTDLRDYSKTMAKEEISDPLELLKSISSLINTKGAIAGMNETTKITGLMRNCKKLVGRCIYLNVLRVTKNEEILTKFMIDGGWKIINNWFSEAKETNNLPIVQEILKLLYRLPVTIQHLRENNTPKIVKHFAKSNNQKLKSSASLLMQSWMAIITGSSASTIETSEPPKKKKKEKKKLKPEEKSLQPKVKSENKSAPPPVMKAPSFAKFRKTGLETEQNLPKKKAKAKPEQLAGKRNSTENDSSVPEKKMKPAPPKKIMISEGEGFMDALNSASNPLPLPTKKIKRRPLKPTPSSNSNSSNSNKSQNQTMEIATGDASDFSATELLRKLSPKGNESPVPIEPEKPKLNKYGKPMKSVRFKSDEYLESIRYFEVDENERVNVSTQSFKDAQHREMMIERQLLKGGKIPSYAGDDAGEGEWKKPETIDGLELLVIPGCNSVEKDIQTEREKTVLMSIFLTKEMVPETPTEPDPEPYEITQPKIIPFDDETAVVETKEPEPEQGATANDIIMKNMLSGIQPQNGADLTEKLKQILQTASAIQTNTGGQPAADSGIMQQTPQPENMQGMWGGGEIPPQGNPQMGAMDMNGQQMHPQMGFFGTQMMVPIQDPNFYGPNWNGPPPPHHGGPPPRGPPPRMFNNQWGGGPQWRGGPPHRGGRNDYRGNWRGRWNNDRRR